MNRLKIYGIGLLTFCAISLFLAASSAFSDQRPITWGTNSIPLPDGSVAVLADAGVNRSTSIPLCQPNTESCSTSTTWSVFECCNGSPVVFNIFDGGVCADGGLSCQACSGTCALDGGFYSTGSTAWTMQLEGSQDQANWFAYPNTSQTLANSSLFDGGSACVSWIQAQGQLMPFNSVQVTSNGSDAGFCWGASNTW